MAAPTLDSGYPVSARDTTTNATDVTWPQFTTPGTNRFVVAIFLGNGSGTNSISTMTSANLTWTKAVGRTNGDTADSAFGNYRGDIWWAWAASVVTNEQIDTAFAGSNIAYDRQSTIILSFAGSDSSGAGNSASDAAPAGDPDLSVTATAADSYIVVGTVYRASGGTQTISAPSTELYLGGTDGGFGFIERLGKNTSSGAGAVSVAWTGDDPFSGGTIVGFEIKTAAGGGGAAAVPKSRIFRQAVKRAAVH
jgi:hypothetical protein